MEFFEQSAETDLTEYNMDGSKQDTLPVSDSGSNGNANLTHHTQSSYSSSTSLHNKTTDSSKPNSMETSSSKLQNTANPPHSTTTHLQTNHNRSDSGFLSSSSSSIEELVTKKRGTAEITKFLISQLKLQKATKSSKELRKFFELLFKLEGSSNQDSASQNSFQIFDSKLRLFLKSVPLTGETHVKTEVLNLFADAFAQTNKDFNDVIQQHQQKTDIQANNHRSNQTRSTNSDDKLLCSNDTVFQLVFSIVLLNTDLHITKEARRMTRNQFILNLNSAVEKSGAKFSNDFLKDVYKSVKERPLPSAEVTKIDTLTPSNSFKRGGSVRSSLRDLKKKLSNLGSPTANENTDPTGDFQSENGVSSEMTESSETVKNTEMSESRYSDSQFSSLHNSISVQPPKFNPDKYLPRYQNWVWRKFDKGVDGSELRPWKRTWKPACVIIRPDQAKLQFMLSIRGENMRLNLHHANTYQVEHKRRGKIIAIQFKNGQRLLLQCSSDKERRKLYNCVIVNSARFSKRPLEAAISAMGTFHQPLMQKSPEVGLDLEEQIEDLNEYLEIAGGSLDELKRTSVVGRNLRDRQFRLDKIKFLDEEKIKYMRYLEHLRAFRDYCEGLRMKLLEEEMSSIEAARKGSTCSNIDLTLCDRVSIHSSIFDKNAMSEAQSEMSIQSAIEAQMRTHNLTDYRNKISTPIGFQSSKSQTEILKTPKSSSNSSKTGINSFSNNIGPGMLCRLNSNSCSHLARKSSKDDVLKPYHSPQAGRKMEHKNGKIVFFGTENLRSSSNDSPRVHFNPTIKIESDYLTSRNKRKEEIYHV